MGFVYFGQNRNKERFKIGIADDAEVAQAG